MRISINADDVKRLLNLIEKFGKIGAFVHEGVCITVKPYASAEVHEAADALSKFLDACYWPEYLETLDAIKQQIDKQTEHPDKDLETVLWYVINDWFYDKQTEFGINDGAEPLDSMVQEMEKNLAYECQRVLEWQKSFVKKVNEDGTVELNIDGKIFVGKFKEE